MSTITKDQVVEVLNQSKDPAIKSHAKDIGMVVALTKVLNASLEFAKEGNMSGGKFAMTMAKKGLATSKVAEKASGSKALEMGNFVVGQGMKTTSMAIGLSKLKSPTSAAAFATFAVAEKAAMAAGLAEFNKCRVAVAQLAATTGITAVAAPTGIGAVVGAIAIAADLYSVYGACYADGKNGKDLTFL